MAPIVRHVPPQSGSDFIAHDVIAYLIGRHLGDSTTIQECLHHQVCVIESQSKGCVVEAGYVTRPYDNSVPVSHSAGTCVAWESGVANLRILMQPYSGKLLRLSLHTAMSDADLFLEALDRFRLVQR